MTMKKKIGGYELIMEFMQLFKTYHKKGNKTTYITLVWARTENGRKWNPQKSIVYEFGNNRPRGRPRQDEVREDGRIVSGEEWHEKVYDREEWKKLLRTARNRHILHMPME
jgi:hypothetical protein